MIEIGYSLVEPTYVQKHIHMWQEKILDHFTFLLKTNLDKKPMHHKLDACNWGSNLWPLDHEQNNLCS